MSVERAHRAFQRFVDALNRPGDVAALAAAIADDAQLDRYAPAGRDATGHIVESFAGIAEVAAWFARMPPAIRFSLVGAAWTDVDDLWGIEYAIDTDGFHNGGIWLARFAGDGRIAALAHRPFALADQPAPTVPPGHGHPH